MQKQLKKNVISKPTDFLPIRSKETVAVTYSGDTVTNIEQVFPDGRRVDLDGKVEEEVVKNITSNGEYAIVPTIQQGYTAMEKARVNVTVPTGESIGVITLNGGLPSTYPDEWNTTEAFTDPKPCKHLDSGIYHYGELRYNNATQTLYLMFPTKVTLYSRSVDGAVGGWNLAGEWS